MAIATEFSPDIRVENEVPIGLVVADFDGTIANTFEDSPAGVNVRTAYEQAIKESLGIDAYAIYLDKGGLRNRSPFQVVSELVSGKTQREVEGLTQKLNVTKLRLLCDEIGTHFPDGSIWPRPIEGYVEFVGGVSSLEEGFRPNHVVLSSGHHAFIGRTLNAWGLFDGDSRPRVFSEELARGVARARGLSVQSMSKPSFRLMEFVLETIYGPTIGEEIRSSVIYVGDDPEKDGGLARNSGVDFVQISTVDPMTSWRSVMEGRTSRRLPDAG